MLKSRLETGQAHCPRTMKSQVSEAELSPSLTSSLLPQQYFRRTWCPCSVRMLQDRKSLSSQKSRAVTLRVFLPLWLPWICLEFCIPSSFIVAQIHTKLQVKLNLFGSFCLSFFFYSKKVKRLCGLKSYTSLCAICWNQIPFTESWMFPWQKPELDTFRKAS